MTEPAPRPVSMEDLRPEFLDGIVGQPEVVRRLHLLSAGVRAGRIVPPHLLFHGPPGVGKTTAARAFAREVLGPEWENSFNTIAASDERGIDFIRSRIVPLLSLRAPRGTPFRIFFFDEADGLDRETQKALRPALEAVGGSCVFVLACNELHEISAALRSRCTELEFGRVGPLEMARAVRDAARRSRLPLDESVVPALVAQARGIPREAIKLLIEAQSVEGPAPRPARRPARRDGASPRP